MPTAVAPPCSGWVPSSPTTGRPIRSGSFTASKSFTTDIPRGSPCGGSASSCTRAAPARPSGSDGRRPRRSARRASPIYLLRYRPESVRSDERVEEQCRAHGRTMTNTDVEWLIEDGAIASEFPLTYCQRALGFLERLAPGNPAYVIAGAARLHGPAEPAALRRAALALAARHPSLRTTFHETEAGPVQRVGEVAQVDFVEIDGPDLGAPGLPAFLAAAAFAPFDLARGPLWRVVLARSPGGEQ